MIIKAMTPAKITLVVVALVATTSTITTTRS